MSSGEIQKLQEGLRSARDAVLSAIEGISEPEAHQVPAPEEWMVAQLLAHIEEIQSYWMSKVIQITREDNPNVNRTHDEGRQRVAAVTDHAQDSLAGLTRRMIDANAEVVAAVGRIDPKDLARVGHRGEGNPVTAGGLIQSLAAHVEEHAGQIVEARRLIRENR
jgi:uncharacterized damage-inducible protein DinB